MTLHDHMLTRRASSEPQALQQARRRDCKAVLGVSLEISLQAWPSFLSLEVNGKEAVHVAVAHQSR